MKLIAYGKTVGTVPTLIFSFRPSELHTIAFKVDSSKGSIEIGTDGVEIGAGFELAAGEALGWNHQDFDKNDPTSAEMQFVYAVASVAPSHVRVYGWMR